MKQCKPSIGDCCPVASCADGTCVDDKASDCCDDARFPYKCPLVVEKTQPSESIITTHFFSFPNSELDRVPIALSMKIYVNVQTVRCGVKVATVLLRVLLVVASTNLSGS